MINHNDPLGQPQNGPEAARVLFENLSKVCSGFPADVVAMASINLLVNGIRQVHPTRDGAAQSFDELTTKAKTVLLNEHYDLTGRRRSIFPFNQTITPEHVVFKNKFGRT